jgi:sec-independent protein translocase protein TatA
MGSGLVTPVHLIFLLLLALLLFGAKRLPEIGRSLGTGMREFKDSVTSHDDKVEARSELPPPAVVPAPPAAPAAPETPPVAAEPERETENVSS